MGVLNSIFNADAAHLTDTDGFGEAITYVFKDGTSRDINAVVFRNPPEPVPGTTRAALAPVLQVFLENHASRGVTSIDTGGDRVIVADRYGGATKVHPIAKIVHQDAGGWKLELR